MYLRPSDLTPAQRGNLVRFVRDWRLRDNHSVALATIGEKEFGSKTGLAHLARKGALRVADTKVGPRGGKELRYTPTPDGLRVADYITVNGLKTWR